MTRPALLAALLLCSSVVPGAGCATGGGAREVALSRVVQTGDRFMGVRLLGTLRLPPDEVDGLPLVGVSALAWDDDDDLLYAISDRGYLFHLRPVLRGGRLVDAARVAAYRLLDARGKGLVAPWRDAEGLTLRHADDGRRGNSELLVSFEVKPRVRRYDNRGRRLGEVPLPNRLSERFNLYRNANQSLEAIAIDPRFGVLLAPERPLRDDPPGRLSVFAGSRRWFYPLSPAAGSALVAFETLADGSLLTLERAFVSLTRPLLISLRRTRLDAAPQRRMLEVSDVAVFDTSKGWLLDNFEGLTAHRDGNVFIVSDDNDSFLQSTLLVYLQLDAPAPAAAARESANP